jgi:hypothetical protein
MFMFTYTKEIVMSVIALPWCMVKYVQDTIEDLKKLHARVVQGLKVLSLFMIYRELFFLSLFFHWATGYRTPVLPFLRPLILFVIFICIFFWNQLYPYTVIYGNEAVKKFQIKVLKKDPDMLEYEFVDFPLPPLVRADHVPVELELHTPLTCDGKSEFYTPTSPIVIFENYFRLEDDSSDDSSDDRFSFASLPIIDSSIIQSRPV